MKQFLMKLCGIKPAPPAEPGWKDEVRRAGYIIYEQHGNWHWYHPPSGGRSGRYTTEHGAWVAARLDHNEWKDKNES